MSRIPHPDDEPGSPYLWLVLDEVVDPQNFGALLRSAFFLGGVQSSSSSSENDSGDFESKIGIMVCSKNSAPPSPVVSAASAGALEICQVYSTSNLPRTLNAARGDGWRILGAAASAPSGMIDDKTGEPVFCQDLFDVETKDENQQKQPTILVLGSEGHGLRNLVAKACSGFVRIPGNSAIGLALEGNSEDVNDSRNPSVGVDSLNVSVTGGIMLWHLLNGKK